MLVAGSFWFKDLSDWLVKTHGKDYPKIPKKIMGKWLINIGALFMPDAKFAKSVWGKEPTFDNSKTKDLLQIPFRSMEVAVQEMADTLIDTGYVKDQRKD
jgi:hypothetical protein